MITKEIWDSLSATQKRERLAETLTQLHNIEEGRHELSGKPEQGKLSFIKKDLEELVLKFIELESPNYEENRPST